MRTAPWAWRAGLGYLTLGAALFALWSHAPLSIPPQGQTALRTAHALAHGAAPWDERAVRFPPLYGALLAPFAAAGLAVDTSVTALHALLLITAMLCLHSLARRLLVRRPVIPVLLWALLPATLVLVRTARADVLVLACTAGALAATASYLQRPSVGALWLAAACCALACLARYLALFTLLPVVTSAVGLAGRRDIRERIQAMAVPAIAGALPSIVWMLYAYRLTGHPLGMSRTAPRLHQIDAGLFENAAALVRTLSVDLFSPTSLGLRRVLYGELAHSGSILTSPAFWGAAFAATLIAFAGWKTRSAAGPAFRERVRQREPRALAMALLLGFAAWYTLVLLVLWTVGNNDPLQSRYVAPLILAGVMLGAALCRAVDAGVPRRAILLLGLAVVCAALPRSARLLREEPGPTLVEMKGPVHGQIFWKREPAWPD